MKKTYTSATMPKRYQAKKLVVFDLDGTLAKTKSVLEPPMASALRDLLQQKKVAVIGGGSYKQFTKQLLDGLDCPPALLANLFLFPTTATSFYRYQKNRWRPVYSLRLSKSERAAIRGAFKDTFKEIGYVPPKKVYGKTLEDRGAQMTYSFLGQDVVAALGEKGVALKEQWTKQHAPLKLQITAMMQQRLPNLEVHAAGFTSIDVTKKGIDKAYGVLQIEKRLKIPVKEMVFVGDALYPGGNDYAAKRSGIDCVATTGPDDTERIIRALIGKVVL